VRTCVRTYHATHIWLLLLLLVVMQVFMKVASKFFQGLDGVSRHAGILFGMGVDGNVSWDYKGPQDNGMA
jgi:hypothetical protein